MSEEEKKTTAELEAEALVAEEREVKLKLDIDFRTLKYYNVFTMKYVRKFQILYIVFIVILLGGAGYSIYTALNAAEGSTANYIIPVIMVLFAIYLGYQMLTFEKMIDKQLTNHFNRQRPVTQVYTINDNGIIVTPSSGGDPVTYEWPFVSSIYKTNEFYYLYIGKQPIIVDRREEMIVEGTKADLDGIIAEKGKTKPFKVIDKVILKEPVVFHYPDYDAMEEARKQELMAIDAEEAKKKAEKEEKETSLEAEKEKEANEENATEEIEKAEEAVKDINDREAK